MNCPIKFTSAVDRIRTLSRAATSDIIHTKLLLRVLPYKMKKKKIDRLLSTVRLAKRQLN